MIRAAIGFFLAKSSVNVISFVMVTGNLYHLERGLKFPPNCFSVEFHASSVFVDDERKYKIHSYPCLIYS